MGTKNSGISAKLSLDNSNYEKGMKQSRDSTQTFAKDFKAFPVINLGPSVKMCDTLTTKIDAGTKNLQRMKFQAESTAIAVTKGMQAMNNVASSLGAGLHVGGGALDPRRIRQAMPAAMTPQRLAEQRRAAEESTRAILINNGITSRYLDDTTNRQRRLREATKGTREEFTATTNGTSRLGQTMLNLGYIADDAQYGLRGLMNNIGPLVLGMGAGAGLAGTVQLLTVALSYGVKWWDEFSGATRRAKEATRQTEMAIRRQADAVEDAGRRGAARAERLSRMNEGRQDFNAGQDAASARFWQTEAAGNDLAAARAGAQRPGESGASGQLQQMRRRHGIENMAENERSRARTEILAGQMGANNYNKRLAEGDIRQMETEFLSLSRDAPDRTARIEGMRKDVEDIRKGGSPDARVNIPSMLKTIREDEAKDIRMKELEPAIPARKADLENIKAREKELLQRGEDIKAERKIFDLNQQRRGEEEKQAQQNIFAENAIKWADGVQRMNEEMADWSREQSKVVTEIRQEVAARREASRQLGEDNRITRLQAGGHERRAARAQNTETARRRVNELMATGRYTREQAEGVARDENPETGRIRRGEDTRRNTNAPSGLDAGTGSALDNFRSKKGGWALDTFRDGNLPTPKEAAEMARARKGNAAAAPAKDGPNTTMLDVLKEMSGTLKQLLTAGEKTPAERAAPLNRR